MTWETVLPLIKSRIQPGTTSILKADGVGTRPVTSNGRGKIGMRTGVTTAQTKAVTYEMIRYAFETLRSAGRFDSHDFRKGFGREYEAAPCRFSMTGGVLVHLGIARIVPAHTEGDCYYLAASSPGSA